MKLKRAARVLVIGVGALAVTLPGTSGHAQSADALIDKLVEKGILTVKEANELREESDKGFTAAHSVKTGLPEPPSLRTILKLVFGWPRGRTPAAALSAVIRFRATTLSRITVQKSCSSLTLPMASGRRSTTRTGRSA